MYTHIKSVQILISLLKQYNIKHIVISPGTRNTALAHSVETDDFFECYSIVDERSAGYFALGISESLDVPVCVTCTAATAACNYFPAIKEAYERNIQLVALTADQDPYGMFHMEDQCIDQVDMFHGYVKCAIDIPKVMNDNDYWYCNRRMNEAFLSLNHNLKEISSFEVSTLPVTRKIERINCKSDLTKFKEELKTKQKILVVAGSDFDIKDTLRKAIKSFCETYNCVVISDAYANIYDGTNDVVFNPKGLGDSISRDYITILKPDLIISFGNIYYSTVKYFIPSYSSEVEHWQISIDGSLNDGYHCLKNVFEGRPEQFFEHMVKNVVAKNNKVYAGIWKERIDKFIYPELEFTNFYVTKEFCARIPENSLFHTTVLDSIRLSNYVNRADKIKCFANIGADGIDGSFSTFLGQVENEEFAFLLTGDLSFMYDMNSIFNRIPNNVRILVINNYAGAEFHKNFGVTRIPTLNRFVAAGHSVKIENCCINKNLNYLSATNQEELNVAFQTFFSESEKPIVLEVFTDAEVDAQTLKNYWDCNRLYSNKGLYFIKGSIKKVIKKLIRRN